MATTADQIKADDAAQKAYEAAASETPSKPTGDPKPAERAFKATSAAADEAPAKAQPAAAKPVKKPAKKKTAARKPAAKKGPSVKKVAQAVSAKTTPKVAKRAAKTPQSPSKDTTMMNTDTNDFTATMKKTASEMQTRLQAAYDKGTVFSAEATELTRGNVEAIVESSKILAGGMQDLSREAVEDTKAAFETLTADMKKLAAVKSPTEFFQLQGEFARRNFDAMVGYSSKRTEKVVKLTNEAIAPLSSRVSIAAEKVAVAA